MKIIGTNMMGIGFGVIGVVMKLVLMMEVCLVELNHSINL